MERYEKLEMEVIRFDVEDGMETALGQQPTEDLIVVSTNNANLNVTNPNGVASRN